ncbi:hypothetical protein FLX56_14835 [Synechococcus moorigangaii CMS01]|nr:hypothetical protein [Synechococcus moorigangaii CMS01]
MLAQILAIAVALGSGLLFLTAFIFPKLHRQDDFFWSAVGLFYALVLWICAGQMAGAILLGQLASVILLGWFAWEMLRLRQAIADPTKIPDLDKVSLVGYVKNRFKKTNIAPTKPAKTQAAESPEPSTSEAESPPTPSDAAATAPEVPTADLVTAPETAESDTAPTPEIIAEPKPESSATAPESTAPEIPEITDSKATAENEAISAPPITAQPSKKGFSFGRFFGRKNIAATTAKPTPEPEANEAEIEDIFGDEAPVTIPERETSTAVATTPETSAEDSNADASKETPVDDAAVAEKAATELDTTAEAEDPPKDTP